MAESKPTKRIVTPQQYGEGWVQLVDGVIIKRSYPPGARRLSDGNYEVDWPPSEAIPLDDRLRIVDAR